MAAPKGNKYALGLTTNGQPPKYETPEQFSEKINDYFESLTVVGENEDGEEITTFISHPTITGLALFLGFESRQSIYDYSKNKDFSYIIKRAQMVIESSYEEMLLSKASTGAIFALKNMGWIDKTHSDITTNDKDINNQLTPELVTKLIDKL